jgi:AcrR family transcriptional regulator
MSNAGRPNQREHILDTALRLMAQNGAAKTSMRLLAKECGLNVAAIYHYFDSKDALLTAVVEERQYASRLAAPPPIDINAPIEDRVARIYREMWDGAIAEEAIWRLLLGEGIQGESAVQPMGAGLLDVVRQGLAAWIGLVIPEIENPQMAAEVMTGQMFIGFIRHIFEPAVDTDDIRVDGEATLIALLTRERHTVDCSE